MNDVIEVGAADKQLRLWAAKEAVRQGELRLAAQAANLQAAEGRATSLFGWTNAGVLAGAALFSSHEVNHQALVIASLAAPAFLTIGFCLVALWPTTWCETGTDIPWLLAQVAEDDSELRNLEAMAKAYGTALDENSRRLLRFSKLLRGAFISFAATAIVAVGLVLFFTSSLACPVVL